MPSSLDCDPSLLLAERSIALAPEKTRALMELVEDASAYLAAARSAGTRAAYEKDFRQFSEWIRGHGLEPVPSDPRMVALYISHLARQLRRKPSTIKRALAAISVMHQRAGHPNPAKTEIVREELRGICNVLGVRPKRAAPLMIAHLEHVVGGLGTDLRGLQDRAIVLTGWSGALRRSEIAGVHLEHLSFLEQGVRVLIPRSKTDQQGEGAYVALFPATRTALCPVRALRAWIEASGCTSGPVFQRLSAHREARLTGLPLDPRHVNDVVKRATEHAGVQPEELGAVFSAHSLRAGFITEAARADKAEWKIAKQSRHRSAETLRQYIRIADTFVGNAGEGLL